MDGYCLQTLRLLVLLGVAAAASNAHSQELLGFDDDLPRVALDAPATVVARDVSPPELAESWPDYRLVEFELPVSVRVVSGDSARVSEVVIEVTGPDRSMIHDFAPATTLDSGGAEPVAVTQTTERSRAVDATLGGQLPIPGLDAVARVTPSVSTGKTSRDVRTETTTRLPVQQPVIVSGTQHGGRGVFYQLRPSPQATIEGQHDLRIQLLVPNCAESVTADVALAANGSRRVLWIDQPQVWGAQQATVGIRIVERVAGN